MNDRRESDFEIDGINRRRNTTCKGEVKNLNSAIYRKVNNLSSWRAGESSTQLTESMNNRIKDIERTSSSRTNDMDRRKIKVYS